MTVRLLARFVTADAARLAAAVPVLLVHQAAGQILNHLLGQEDR